LDLQFYASIKDIPVGIGITIERIIAIKVMTMRYVNFNYLLN